MQVIIFTFIFEQAPDPTFATHAVCKTESVAQLWVFMGWLKFQGQMFQKKHFKGSQLQLII